MSGKANQRVSGGGHPPGRSPPARGPVCPEGSGGLDDPAVLAATPAPHKLHAGARPAGPWPPCRCAGGEQGLTCVSVRLSSACMTDCSGREAWDCKERGEGRECGLWGTAGNPPPTHTKARVAASPFTMSPASTVGTSVNLLPFPTPNSRSCPELSRLGRRRQRKTMRLGGAGEGTRKRRMRRWGVIREAVPTPASASHTPESDCTPGN